RQANEYYASVSVETDMVLQEYAKVLGGSHAGLIPTFSLIYSVFPFARNPWQSPSAALIHPDSIFLPLNQETGKWDTPRWSLPYVEKMLAFENVFYKHGAKYLTGTGTDAFGTLPGISMHSELEML